MKMMIRKLTASALLTVMAVSCVSFSALAAPLSTPPMPDSLIVDGREFFRDESSVGITLPDNAAMQDSKSGLLRASYRLIASDVWIAKDDSHGHGVEHGVQGWVQTTAPSFYARAEKKRNGVTVQAATNTYNKAGTDISYSVIYPTYGYAEDRAYIYYGW